MHTIPRILLTIYLVFQTVISFGQCKQQVVYNCAMKNGGIYLKDYNYRMQYKTNRKPSVEIGEMVLLKGITYRFNFCTLSGFERSFAICFFNEDDSTEFTNPLRIVSQNENVLQPFDYYCNKTGKYYLSFQLVHPARYSCVVGILAFQRRNDTIASKRDPYDKKANSKKNKIKAAKEHTCLHLAAKKLRFFPLKVKRLKELDSLFIGENKLRRIPGSVKKMKQLKMLDLSYNTKMNFEKTFKSLSKLKEIDTYSINKQLACYDFFEEIELTSCYLNELPGNLAKIKNLRRLILHSNNIISIPDWIANLCDLEYIDLRNNPIEDGEIERLKGVLPDCEVIY